MKHLLLTISFFLLLTGLFGQRYSYLTNGPISENLPFITAETFSFYLVPLQQDGFPQDVRLRWVDGRGNKSEWHVFKQDGHADPERYVSELDFANKRQWTNFELDMPASGPVNLYFFDPGQSTANHRPQGQPAAESACFQPLIQGRLDWCPDGSCPTDPTPVFTDVTHLIVHHSVSVNTSNDWPAIVRSIWNFHTSVNFWDDIGYNYLVDPNGVIYEGRGNNLRGAHFCGKNSNTMGTCLLGNFTDQLPTEAALESLAELQAWKAAQNAINPVAITYHAGGDEDLISLAAHRDGCNTECPGNTFYAVFDEFRATVNGRLLDCLASNTKEIPIWGPDVVLAPNPGNGPVRITGVPTEAKLSLFSPNGKMLGEFSGTSKVTDVEAAITQGARGVFFLRIEAGGEVVTKKVIRN
jgi:hypothetical protein